MEIYNTIGWALILLPIIVTLLSEDWLVILDPRPILAIAWGIYLVWRF